MTTIYIDFQCSVEITINDPSVVARCVENHDDEGVSQPDVKGGTGWRNMFYPLTTEADVLEHLAFNCSMNGVENANRLDGWSDLPDDAATMSLARDTWCAV